MKNAGLFDEMKSFVNTKKSGEEFSRQEMLQHLIETGDVLVFPTTGAYTESMDNYRRQLTGAGFIEPTDKRGVYCKMKSIPKKTTSTKLRNLYKKETQRVREERAQKISRLLRRNSC